MKTKKISKLQIYLALNSLALSGISLVLARLITKYDMLPMKFLIPALLAVIGIPLLLIFFMLRKKTNKKIKVILSIISILLITLYTVISIFIKKTYNFIEEIIDDGYVIENYSVITLKDREYNELKDLENEIIGYSKSESPAQVEALEQIGTQIEFLKKEHDDTKILIDNLYEEKVKGILIEDSYRRNNSRLQRKNTSNI